MEYWLRTFRQALFVLPGTARATCFQLSFWPCIATAWIKRLSSSAVQGRPTTLSAMTYGPEGMASLPNEFTEQRNQGAPFGALIFRSIKTLTTARPSTDLDPLCLSFEVTPLVRMKTRYCILMMPLDSLRSLPRRNRAWSHQTRCRLFHTLPQMCSQKYGTHLPHLSPWILKGFVTGPSEANLAYHPAYRYANEREHHL